MSRYLRLLFALVLLLGLAGCAMLQSSIQQPEIQVQQVDITRLSLSDVDLAVRLGVHNPNPIGLRLAGLNYRLEAEQRALLQGSSEQALRVGAGEQAAITLPLSLSFADLAGGLQAILGRDKIDYVLSGELDFGLFRVPYSHHGELTLPKLPRIRIQDLRVEQLNLQGARLTLSLGVDNPNGFPLRLNGLEYELSLDGKSLSRGQSLGPMVIEGGTRGSQPIQLSIDTSKLGSLFQQLSSGSKIPVSLDASLNLPGLRGEHQLPLSWQGELAVSR